MAFNTQGTSLRSVILRFMSGGTRWVKLSASAANLETLLGDVPLLGLWEFIRAWGRPVSLQQLSVACSLEPSTAQRKLDVLIAHQLIESLPIKGRRRTTTYRSICDGLMIECRLPHDLPLVQRIVASYSDGVRAAMAESPMQPGPDPPTDWRTGFHSLFHISPSETCELQRRVQSLIEYIDLLGEKRPSNGETPNLSNYGISLRVDPLPRPALPLPRLRFIDEGTAQTKRQATTTGRSPRLTLSSREREVGLALMRGLSRPEVAKELGIAVATVATLTKRLHTKLGVHRRSQLVTRMREIASGAGD